MVKTTLEIPDKENRILNIVKGQNDAARLSLISKSYGREMLEPELRPEFVKEMRRVEKQKGIPFKDIKDLRKQIEG